MSVAVSSVALPSCAAVTATVCAVFQSDAVKVSGPPAVTSSLSLDTVTVTLAVGSLSSATV